MKPYKKRLVNGVWQRYPVGSGVGMRSQQARCDYPTKKEYKKMVKKGKPVPLVLGGNICPTCGQPLPQNLPPAPSPGSPPPPPS